MSINQQDKDQFFQNLEKLDDLSTESEGENQLKSTQQLKDDRLKIVNNTLPHISQDALEDVPSPAKRVRKNTLGGSQRPQSIQPRSGSVISPPRARPRSELAFDPNASFPTTISPRSRPVRPASSPAGKSKLPDVPKLRRSQSEHTKSTTAAKPKDKKQKQDQIQESEQIFHGLVFFFIPNSDSAPVRRRRIRMAVARGATWARSWTDSITHIIVDFDLHFDKAKKELPQGGLPEGMNLVKDTWLVECFSFREVRDTRGTRFVVSGMTETGAAAKQVASFPAAEPPVVEAELPESPNPDLKDELSTIVDEVKQFGSLPDISLLIDETSFNSEPAGSDDSMAPSKGDHFQPRENAGFACMEKHEGSDQCPNARTIQILQEMATHYDQMGDHWRTLAYRKAIGALRKQPELIKTSKEAAAIFGIGTRLADKIEEIVTTDCLQRLESTKADPNDQLIRLFMGVYGAGLAQARAWIASGHRTLKDLAQKGQLTPNQKIGVEHYDDFQQRIPRDEMTKLAASVKIELLRASAQLLMTIGGSYRRGKADSGDIDILITKRGSSMSHIRCLVVDTVIPRLMKTGFLKIALAETARDTGSKWHGACALKDSPWRRIDLLFVPWDELGAALIYFTGNDIFNRSLRLLASRKGMRLNQHGLFRNVLRGKGRLKVTEGELLEGHSEERIFELLGVPYRPPEHRQC